MVNFDEFKKLDIRIARIKDVKPHPNADKLYILIIDLGSEERQIVAGIRPYYKPEELMNRNIVVVANMEPATIRGAESKGMLLAAKDEKTLAILIPDRDIETGSPIS